MILSQYIKRSVTTTVLLVAVIFVGLIIFIGFLGELKHLGQGSYGVWQAFLYVVLSVPLQFYMLFPMIGLIGCLLGLGLLASHQELTVMRSAGVSINQISRMVLVTIVIMIIVVTVIGELFGPYLMSVANDMKTLAENSGQTLAIGNSVWLKQNNDFIYVNKIKGADTLQGVTVYTFNQHHQLTQNIYAQSAVYHNGQWQLHHVQESDVRFQGVTSQDDASRAWSLHLAPSVFRMTLQDPDEMNLWNLWHFIQSRKANGIKVRSYQINFWQRVYQPLAMVIMMLLAIPFVFGSLRSLTIGFRIFVGIIVGFAFVMLTNIVGQLSALITLPPAVSTLFPLLIFAVLGLVFVNWRMR